MPNRRSDEGIAAHHATQPRMHPGEQGKITTAQLGKDLFEARTYIRDTEGVRRKIRRTKKSTEDAERNLPVLRRGLRFDSTLGRHSRPVCHRRTPANTMLHR
jgi:hypothetical protein